MSRNHPDTDLYSDSSAATFAVNPALRPAWWRFVLGGWFIVVFLSLGLFAWLAMFLPHESTRRQIAHKISRLIFLMGGCAIDKRGFEKIPARPCIIVANHQSYLDGPLLRALLPPSFNFVIKSGMRDAPLAGFLLRRIGSEFVERNDRHRGAIDAKRFFKKATEGATWVIFPEGTFDIEVGVLPFLEGGFGAARHAQLPVLTIAIQGTRAILPTERFWPCPNRIRVSVLTLHPVPHSREAISALCQVTRQEIASQIGEPLIEPAGPPKPTES